VASEIKNFVTSGRAMTYRQRSVRPNNGGKPSRVYHRRNATLGISGGGVRVTNPKASLRSAIPEGRRLGMHGY